MGQSIDYFIQNWLQSLFQFNNKLSICSYPLWTTYLFEHEGIKVRFGVTQNGPTLMCYVAVCHQGIWKIYLSAMSNKYYETFSYWDWERGLLDLGGNNFYNEWEINQKIKHIQENATSYLMEQVL